MIYILRNQSVIIIHNMLVKFFNGNIVEIRIYIQDDIELLLKDIDLSDQVQVDIIVKYIYNYIIQNQDDTGIDNNDLMFFEQIEFFIKESEDGMIYVFIHSIDSLHIKMAFSWIECLPIEEINQKTEKYLQYLANRHMLYLSIGRKYCELYFKDYEYMEKISTIWEEDLDLKINIYNLDSDKYLCKNVPIYIGYQLYEPNLIFHKDDID